MGTATLRIQRTQSKSRLPRSWSLLVYWDQAEPRDQVLVSDTLWQVMVDGRCRPSASWEAVGGREGSGRPWSLRLGFLELVSRELRE